MRREILLLVAVIHVAGCGLINALTGAAADGLVCDADDLCFCPNAPDSVCVGDGCRCDEDGVVACTDSETICSLLDDDGCANDGCVCHDEGSGECVCDAAPGTCSTTSGSIVLTDNSSDSCLGDCSCSLAEGCACLSSACAYGVDGAACNEDTDCQVLQMATSTDCTADRDCEAGEFCGDVPGGETGCFVTAPEAEDCVTLDTRDGGQASVCVNNLARAVCVDGLCAGSITD